MDTIAPTPMATAESVNTDPNAGTPTSGPADTQERVSRRKKAVLGLLFLGFLVVILLTVWYLLFRKPITEIPLPGTPTPLPTYQGSIYQLSKPQGVAVSKDGSRIYVTQTGAALDTVILDNKGHAIGKLTPPANLIAQPHQLSVAVSPVTGEIWATDRYDAAVLEYAADGTFIKVFDQGADRSEWQPLGIAFDSAGNVYVSDVATPAGVIHVFGADGKFLRDFGQEENLNHPNGIAVGPDGTVYVTDTGNGRLVVFDNLGKKLAEVARGAGQGNLGLPVGIAFDDHGKVEVADSGASTVQVYEPFSPNSRAPLYIGGFGEQGSGDGNLMYPNGLAADGQGRVYVADWGNDRLEVWSY